jgi:hypothetical protein
MENVNILLGVVVAVPIITLLAAYWLDARTFSAPPGRRFRAAVTCHECVGTNGPACTSGCGTST